MYTEIGKKIKLLAMVTAVVMALISVVGGFSIIAEGYLEDVIAGLLVMLVGVLVAWVSSWVLYGFGELIDKTVSIEERLSIASDKTEQKEKMNTADEEKIEKIKSLYSAGLLSEDEYKEAIYKAGGTV
ncbi:MAG: hypothetical protein IKB38_07655 [Clostridia bacterium]|nr:hypothetical protein [Clostridia bacterium]